MRELVDLLVLSYWCLVTVNVLWLFIMMAWIGLQYVIVFFPDHNHLLFKRKFDESKSNSSVKRSKETFKKMK